ncbi:alpha/beta hydrolase family protein [Microtetraspora fusca]|uniref:alpha/beta hydrolase family protein n=1 Tax=Microtetraspora fusca TaxID=1997 RepID=UPI000831C53E|nr:hypothetical protein [Microtetraspora fusca]
MSTMILRGALAAAVALLTVATPAAAAVSSAPHATAAAPSTGPAAEPSRASTTAFALPEPTGPHPVGTTTLHLVDGSRPDPWVPSAKERELMVTMWYPARAAGGRRAPYMTREEATLVLKGLGTPARPEDAARLSRTRTNSFLDVPPAGRRRGLPLVVLSPGFSVPRSSLTSLAEDLASKGYAVAGIDHVNEAFGTSLPGGRTATCAACDHEDDDDFGDKTTRGRAADVSFVLDRLLGPRPAWDGADLIDPSRIAMAGHSIGGNSASWTMLTDPRVRAGVNMDGTFHVPIPDTGLGRPFLMFGAGRFHEPGGIDFSWDRDWRRMTGWKRWITVRGMEHVSLCDYPLFAPALGLKLDATLSGPRTVKIFRAYVGAFMDLHLRSRPQPLLDGPSRHYPEVRFWR